jgi:hypothetical protein
VYKMAAGEGRPLAVKFILAFGSDDIFVDTDVVMIGRKVNRTFCARRLL